MNNQIQESQFLNAEDVTLKYIGELVGNTIDKLHTFYVSNGCRITAKRKVTIRQGLIHTNYLHVTNTKPSGHYTYYREQKDGSFKSIGWGHDWEYAESKKSNSTNSQRDAECEKAA